MVANPRTFRCLNCDRMIDDSMTQCRYCNMRVDAGVAQLIAERQKKASQSYSEARYIRLVVIAMYVFIVVSYIPRVWFLGLGIAITYFVVFGWLIRWQRKFGPLVTNDAAYLKARRLWRFSLVLWFAALPLGAFVRLLIHLLVRAATR